MGACSSKEATQPASGIRPARGIRPPDEAVKNKRPEVIRDDIFRLAGVIDDTYLIIDNYRVIIDQYHNDIIIHGESRLLKYYDYMFAIQEYLYRKIRIPLLTKEDGNTPIHVALITKRFRAALFLLINIPSLDGIKNNKMQTWIHTLGYSEINQTEFNECNYWLYLEGRQIELNVRDKYGNTPLHYAAMRTNKFLYHEFVKLGADPNVLNNRRKTPLMIYTNTPARRGSNGASGSGPVSAPIEPSAPFPDSSVDSLVEQLYIFDSVSKTPPSIIETGASESKDTPSTESTAPPVDSVAPPVDSVAPPVDSVAPPVDSTESSVESPGYSVEHSVEPPGESPGYSVDSAVPEVSCAICLESGVNLKVFVPCGHTVCVDCDESMESRLERCHICTAAIEKKIRLYL
jgi:hypothetical protein